MAVNIIIYCNNEAWLFIIQIEETNLFKPQIFFKYNFPNIIKDEVFKFHCYCLKMLSKSLIKCFIDGNLK